MENQIWFSNPKLLILVLLPYLATFSCLAHPNHLCRHDDHLSLLEFKHNLITSVDYSVPVANLYCEGKGQNPYPKMMSWNATADCCSWDGVNCHEITGHVIGIDLSCGQLVGLIVANSSLFRLSQLERLNLAFNDLQSWTFPGDNFPVFPRLTYLNLSFSNVEGRIPSILSHYSRLESLDLSGNPLNLHENVFENLIRNLTLLRILSLAKIDLSSWKVPVNFSSSLTYLDLSETGVHVIILHHALHLPNLKTLLLQDNYNLNGALPELDCSTPHLLQVLDLSGTQVSGKLLDSISCVKSLLSLSLGSCGFSGSIPESIGNLTQLIYLDLSSNMFSGHFPSMISNLSQLTTIDLSFNLLQGHIPAESFSNLKKLTSLKLAVNNFTERFPSSVTNLTKLRELDFSSNSLTGALPTNATGLQQLSYLSLDSNFFSGSIPSYWSGLPSLGYLYLSNNRFTGISGVFKSRALTEILLTDNQLYGPFPVSISTLIRLERLNLERNHLSGIVEESIFSNLTQLYTLDLAYNRLSWRGQKSGNISLPHLIALTLTSCDLREFPSFIRNSKALQYLDLSDSSLMLWRSEEMVNISLPSLVSLSLYSCNLSEFPYFLRSLDNLEILILSHNNIQGQIPSIPWMNITVLDLGFNRLQGPLPISICNSRNIILLDLSNNEISGAMPRCFGNFSQQIEVLNLKNNSIQGRITMTFARGCSLIFFGLNRNHFEGPLPRSLVNCTQLQVLDVGNNKINGTFPSWLGNLEELNVLILKSNTFFGSIANFNNNHSFSNLRILDISSNQFNGSIPAKLLKTLSDMMRSEKSNTNASYMQTYPYVVDSYDSVDVVVKGLGITLTKILTTLKAIDLSQNNFSGEIPSDIGKLISLKYLSLSHNRLTGHIPSTLANLTSLESLDLSWNQLDGEIPWQLTNLTFLSFLNLSENKLEGQIPHGKQFDTFSNDSYRGNIRLCGFPLTRSCEAPPPPLPQLPIDHEEEESSYFFREFTWKAVTMGYGFGLLLGLAMGSLIFLTGKPKCVARFLENEVYRIASLLFRKNRAHKRFRRPNRR